MKENTSFYRSKQFLFACVLLLLTCNGALASVYILENWTLVEDPPHPGFTASNLTATTAELYAGNQAIPNATDIGFQSIDGATASTSTTGFAFNPDSDFKVAIDYSLSFGNSPTGGLALGFGVGESSDGANSAGGVLATTDGNPFAIGSFGRINDADVPPSVSFPLIGLAGSINVAYTALSGDITVGFAATGTEASVFTGTFSGIQNSWNGDALMVSFFMRSEEAAGAAWTEGTAEATFSNLRVVSGAPVAVPEPASYSLIFLIAAGAFICCRRRR